MRKNPGLRQRFILICVVQAVTISVFFLLLSEFMIERIEQTALTRMLSVQSEWLLTQTKYLNFSDRFNDQEIVIFRFRENDISLIPEVFRLVKEGVDEVESEGYEYLTYRKKKGEYTYIIAINNAQFEKIEGEFRYLMWMATILAILLGGWIGRILCGYALRPVSNLAIQVKKINDVKETYELSSFYDDDLVGQLALVFERQLNRIQELLDKEKYFVGDVSHELRTPLMVISGAVDVILSKPDLPNNTQGALTRIKVATSDIASLVDTFLFISQDTVYIKQKFEEISVNRVVAESILSIKSNTGKQNIEIKFIESARVSVQATPDLLAVVIGNILRNAVSYSNGAMVAVEVTDTNVIISDEGPGIPQSIVDQIFNKKQRVSREQAQGYGMGLAIAKRICDISDWQLELITGKSGSSFIIAFTQVS